MGSLCSDLQMECKWQANQIERFIESVKDLPELITEFDESLWAGLVDSMTVHGKDRIVFRLTCGTEIEV